MSEIQDGGPAFPWCGDLNQCPTINMGMTLRQYSAIKLRVPNSGTDWLDDMIRESQRNDFAAKAIQGIYSNPDRRGTCCDAAVVAFEVADAMQQKGQA